MAAEVSTGHAAEPSIVQKVAYIFTAADEDDDGLLAVTATTPTRRGGGGGSGGGGGRGQKHRTRNGDDEDQRAAKKRRTGATMEEDGDGGDEETGSSSSSESALAAFPSLLQGREAAAAVALRQRLYASTWARLEGRMQEVLQDVNRVTLRAVLDFVEQPVVQGKLPAGFIVLGPAATADSLLFPQLAAELAGGGGGGGGGIVGGGGAVMEGGGGGRRLRVPVRRLIRFRAAEALNLRAALKTIVQEVTASTTAMDDDEQQQQQQGYKYLSYDLEAVAAALPKEEDECERPSRIVVAFEDSEAFDARLLADLIAFLHSWLDRIPFVLLFGVATSVDLFQARLSKQAAHRLAAAQFDVAPSSAVLDRLVEALATVDGPPLVGPTLLRSLLERQDEQVTGISVFVHAVQYAYMCCFYGNALSVLLADDDDDDDEKGEFLRAADYQKAIRQLPSFRRHVEGLVAAGRLDAAKQLLDDSNGAALQQAVRGALAYQRRWTVRLLRAVRVALASGVFGGQSFSALYLRALRGREQDEEASCSSSLAAAMTNAIRRMSAPDLEALLRRLSAALQVETAETTLTSESETNDDDWHALPARLDALLAQLVALQQKVQATHAASQRRNKLFVMQGVSEGGSGSAAPPPLRSKYTAQAKVLRTTVVAQKVQLSRDALALTAEDHAFTEVVDQTVDLVVAGVVDVHGVDGGDDGGGGDDGNRNRNHLWLQEVWLYDARTPYRDVFLPKPGVVVERALARPHDYLACACCRPERADKNDATGSIRATLPATAILYQLYREAGPLINVADLWDAFLAVVGGEREEKEKGKKKDDADKEDDEGKKDDADDAERRHLVQFYQALAEMKALGFVKQTRRKVDHVAKVKWL